MLSHFTCVQPFVTLWTIARQAPLSMGFSRQESWSRLPGPPLGDLPNPGIERMSLTPPALAGSFFTTSATWEAGDWDSSLPLGTERDPAHRRRLWLCTLAPPLSNCAARAK